MSVRIYVEGGFDGTTKTNCRKGFRIFFEKFLRRGSFQIIASGDRASAYKDFCIALKQHRNDFVVLLVDSEEDVQSSPWQHLKSRAGDGWAKPSGATDDQAHLMVQIMESWFLADIAALARYYGQGFLSNSFPGETNIERVAKIRVYELLKHATRQTLKGEYHKTRHGFDLMEEIDPARVRQGSKHAERLFDVLARET